MSIASRLPVLVGLVLGSSAACSANREDPSYKFPTSSFCKRLDDEAAALPECARPTCSGEKKITVAGADLCAWEKQYLGPGPMRGLDCTTLCGAPTEEGWLRCDLPDPDSEQLRAMDGKFDGTTCPYLGKVDSVEITCSLIVDRPGAPCVTEGRRPTGWSATGGAGANAIGAYFASCAELEAISVDAFRELAAELAFHGAPRDLVDRCEQAAREEVAHASLVGALARRFGAEMPAITRAARTDVRPLVDIALENAVEGCVRELFGAAQARVRASCARDAEIRAVMARIADDEARHADLSAAIAAYLYEHLTPAERACVRRAMAYARRELRTEIAMTSVDPELQERAGVPAPDVALALFDVVTTTFSRRDRWACPPRAQP